ncbi:unnamed protein product [Ilex paraguariensis]|uniref:Uncharacterized protein n=1 Tax=Ilex paraguariensis TaxID=185542 RepID=A0ABC8T684_9AQUA
MAASLSEESSIMDLVVTLHLKAMVENMELVSPAHMEATVADTEMVVVVHKEEDIEGMVVGVVPAAVVARKLKVDDDEWVGDDGERVVACHKEGIVMVVGIGTAVDGHKVVRNHEKVADNGERVACNPQMETDANGHEIGDSSGEKEVDAYEVAVDDSMRVVDVEVWVAGTRGRVVDNHETEVEYCKLVVGTNEWETGAGSRDAVAVLVVGSHEKVEDGIGMVTGVHDVVVVLVVYEVVVVDNHKRVEDSRELVVSISEEVNILAVVYDVLKVADRNHHIDFLVFRRWHQMKGWGCYAVPAAAAKGGPEK